jgi:RNA-directed DNA polymerase
VKVAPENRQKLTKQAIKHGLGIRQGMPMSPLLTNLALADFDREISNEKLEMVRYADDIVLFFHTKESAKAGDVKELLQRIQLTIPEIADGSKTVIVSRSEPLPLLGREIVYLGGFQHSFVARVATKQIDKIKARLCAEFSFDHRSKSGKNFQGAIVDLSKSISAYLGIYKDAHNYNQLKEELRGQARTIIVKLFKDLFGEQSLSSLTAEGREFLGIEILDALKPNPELDV